MGSGTGTRTGLSWTKIYMAIGDRESIVKAYILCHSGPTIQSAGECLSLHDSVIDVLVHHFFLAELAAAIV